eukprot:1949910-Amphidinium_carterae.1
MNCGGMVSHRLARCCTSSSSAHSAHVGLLWWLLLNRSRARFVGLFDNGRNPWSICVEVRNRHS